MHTCLYNWIPLNIRLRPINNCSNKIHEADSNADSQISISASIQTQDFLR